MIFGKNFFFCLTKNESNSFILYERIMSCAIVAKKSDDLDDLGKNALLTTRPFTVSEGEIFRLLKPFRDR